MRPVETVGGHPGGSPGDGERGERGGWGKRGCKHLQPETCASASIAPTQEEASEASYHSSMPPEKQTKVVVYGVLYGQSPATLGQQLGERTGAAWKIRETVLRAYPRLREYLRSVKEECRQCG